MYYLLHLTQATVEALTHKSSKQHMDIHKLDREIRVLRHVIN